MGSGVKVVGETHAPSRRDRQEQEEFATDTQQPAEEVGQPTETVDGRHPTTRSVRRGALERPVRAKRGRFGVFVLAVVALAGIAGTITFQRAWSNVNSQNVAEAQARQAASTFLVALTNFDAKSVDNDFARITAMATGPFAKQANQFFNSSIRQQLETALASSRGQIRNIYVQSASGGGAAVYAVVDQLYVNRTLSAPQSDVLRVVVQMADTGGTWKVSDVTVLEGPSLTSPSPSSGSSSSSG